MLYGVPVDMPIHNYFNINFAQNQREFYITEEDCAVSRRENPRKKPHPKMRRGHSALCACPMDHSLTAFVAMEELMYASSALPPMSS